MNPLIKTYLKMFSKSVSCHLPWTYKKSQYCSYGISDLSHIISWTSWILNVLIWNWTFILWVMTVTFNFNFYILMLSHQVKSLHKTLETSHYNTIQFPSHNSQIGPIIQFARSSAKWKCWVPCSKIKNFRTVTAEH